MKFRVLLLASLLMSGCQPQAPSAKRGGLCPTDSTGQVTEDLLPVAAWKADLVSCSYGPAESDALETTLYLKEDGQPLRRLANGLTGSMHPLATVRRVFACQDNTILGPTAPMLIDLAGQAKTLLPHMGSLRACNAVGTGEQVLMQYDDLAATDSALFSIVRVYDAAGMLLVEQRFEREGSIAFTVDGKAYTAEVLEPEMPD